MTIFTIMEDDFVSNEEIVKLVQQDDEHKMEYIDLLYRQNDGLITKAAMQFEWAMELDDLKQEAFFSLLHAAKDYDRSKGTTFATYLWNKITWGLMRYVSNQSNMIHISQSVQSGVRTMQNVIERYQKEYRRNPTEKELALMLECSKAEVMKLKKAYIAMSPLSLDYPLTEDQDATLADTVKDPNDYTEPVLDRVCNEELAAAIWEAVGKLSDRESYVVKSRFKDGLTFRECSEKLGVSLGRVQQIERESFSKIRTGASSKKLKSFLPDKAESIALHRVSYTSFMMYGSATEQAALKLLGS